MTIFLIIIAVIVMALAIVTGWLIWWFRTGVISETEWRKGKMTPVEINAALAYAADHPTKRLTVAGSETEIHPDIQAQNQDLVEAQRQAKQKAIRERLAAIEAQRQAEAEAQRQAEAKELAAIQRDFPAWLIALAEKRNLQRDYIGLQALAEWINQILTFGQETGRLSVPAAYKQFGRSDQAPPKASSWYFFEDLLKALEMAGLIQARPGNAGRLVLGTLCVSRAVIHETSTEGQ